MAGNYDFQGCNFSGIIDIKDLPMLKRFDPDIPQLSLLSIPLAELQGVCQKELAKPGHFRYRRSTNWVTDHTGGNDLAVLYLLLERGYFLV